MRLSRRSFFAMAAASAIDFRALTAQDKAKVGMNVLSRRPEDLEMPLTGFADYITPIEHFFVRTHVYVPTVNINDWRLTVDGDVGTPLNLTMDDLKKLPSSELVCVVECAGNGRSFADPQVPGLQWSNGSVGNGRWRGVRLGDVLKRAGIKDSGKEVVFNGADVPIGNMQDFRRSITVKKALDANTLLAYEMNGVTLPVKHGFPLRVVAPGWASDSWVKWLTNITVMDKEFDGFWMKSAYRKPDHPIAPGSAMPPEKMVPVTSLRVKSVIASPVDGTTARLGDTVTLKGVAWSGDKGPITQVDVSIDGGRTWKASELGVDKSQFGWRQWTYSFRPDRENYYNVMARATDSTGDKQPFSQEWNPSGYGWNVVPRIGINVLENPAVSTQGSMVTPPPAGAAPSPYKETCLTCHEEDVIRQQHLTKAQWDREITKMTNWGAPVTAENRDSILNYLVQQFSRR
jgi:DMSO/TMAO reductase YedYZ molybdopterin-dependent catalytic subunit